MDKPTVGFIGLGEMGEPMARRLLQHGFPVVSCANRTRATIEALTKVGLVEVADPAEVGARADIVMTIVVDQAQTDTVLRGTKGALASLRPGSVIVVMSTLAPGYCQDLAREAATRDVAVLDCPVSGARMAAEQGTLALMVGGDAAALATCRAALEAMGTIFNCGDVGMGMVAKLANNAVSIGTGALLIEARKMARAYGMDLDVLLEIMCQGTANSFVVQNFEALRPLMAHMATLGGKDIGLAVAAAQAQGVAMPMLRAWQTIDWSTFKPDEA
ncbi:MAG: NAD(P)-dependent oxidoreductase [Alphaproteobacteria bacterium]